MRVGDAMLNVLRKSSLPLSTAQAGWLASWYVGRGLSIREARAALVRLRRRGMAECFEVTVRRSRTHFWHAATRVHGRGVSR